ncbi:hypothetical protein OG562_24760 [Streptomyces sp. NBC_01275]|uniref:hypothetical protein n=1 Tax=Streptomyces sp. NBC_01275 TaxID=2903807 RepID=UPI00224EAFE6|nr:hypothetical protein [Streptomyces sp. NBC_01275]MCX4764112.1 hypothetical protein [Streptomyces sp. NBC_01275]
MRRMRGLAVWGAVAVWGAASPAFAAQDVQDAAEADLSYHGFAVMDGGRVDVRLTPRNHGPADVADATVRLRWSAPLAAGAQGLPEGCARTGERSVVCRTGPLGADETGERIELGVWLRGRPTEVTLEVDTVWSGGAVDRNRANDRQQVLVLDTGDSYFF